MMPFDGRVKDYETKPDVFSLEGLIAWLETQNPETKYEYTSPTDCVLCRYFRAHGYVNAIVTRDHLVGERHFPMAMKIAAHGCERWPDRLQFTWNYGAALERARALKGGR
jgi:hypothetical protein